VPSAIALHHLDRKGRRSSCLSDGYPRTSRGLSLIIIYQCIIQKVIIGIIGRITDVITSIVNIKTFETFNINRRT
jgi:hypothetical protein